MSTSQAHTLEWNCKRLRRADAADLRSEQNTCDVEKTFALQLFVA
jgi:hypothetical protein